MSRVSERLYSIAARVENRGVARTADDVRGVADDLRGIADYALRSDSVRIRVAIQRLTRICARLRRARLLRCTNDLGELVEDLRRLLES